MKKVTKRQAEAVLRAVKKMFGSGAGEYGPQLRDRREYDGQPGWQIHWEGGPFEWPYLFPFGGVDEELASMAREFVDSDAEAGRVATRKEVQLPPGIWVEAINHWSIAIYREEE